MVSDWYFIYSVIHCSVGHCVGRCVLVIMRVVVTSVSPFICFVMVPEWFQNSNWVSFVFLLVPIFSPFPYFYVTNIFPSIGIPMINTKWSIIHMLLRWHIYMETTCR